MWRTLQRWWLLWQAGANVRRVPVRTQRCCWPVSPRTGRAVLGAFLALAILGPASAEVGSPQEKTVRKRVNGEVTFVTKHAINVEYDRKGTASFEITIPVKPETRLVHVKRVTDLSPGDVVSVTYDQLVRESEDGPPMLLDTQAMEIQLVRRGQQDTLRSQETDDTGGEE